MEHVTITELTNGYKKLNPDEGYILVHDWREHSEAVVKEIKGWSVKEIIL